MIARAWHGFVPAEKAEAYRLYLLKTGVIDLKATKGNRDVYIFMTETEGKAHYQMISLWDSYESIRMFTGEDYELARYYPEDKDYLLELEKYVTHYEELFVSEQLKSQGFVH